VLEAIGQGDTNLEIAQRFTLTESTVKKHVGRVLAEDRGVRPDSGGHFRVRHGAAPATSTAAGPEGQQGISAG
jgi:hypothetical protein